MKSLRAPDIRVPRILRDLASDLRDRRLLPVIAVLVVAIAAVPFVLSSSGAEIPVPPASGGAAGVEPGSKLAVIADGSGLRDYHRRLTGDRPKNPFRQRFTSPQLAGSQLGGGASGPTTPISAGSTPPADTGAGSDLGGAPPANGNGEGGEGSNPPDSGGGETEPAYVVHLHVGPSDDMQPRDLSEPTPLPSIDNPVVVFQNLGSKGHSGIFRVDESVSAIYGDAKCLKGTDRCELVEIQPGSPVMFVYGDPERSLMLKIDRIEHNR
jgi:hypothetical protein